MTTVTLQITVISREKIMIKNFKDKTLQRLFREDIPATSKQEEKIKNRLETIVVASKIEDIRIPGYGLHELKGDRKGTWSIKISGNWRITFRFEDGNAYDLNFEDYH
ncbi:MULTISPECIES: type II toxin-antitoxin system RelE/ParE family toxin [Pseudanabaena]|uniref:type II toxin-antitoxin system RelE/ParE family toxin n=1 Tax=Pseudanabaena TaxID=1152 RepID=UPI002478D7B1|nr:MULTISPECIES: type II toxin-antitoxin system RelE/ParE family toxin [Pseudanabaena]MEA5485639.1 type II toxin-antitoxin system RelE/ParE family toxin [Pseudanabaena sp. CCNP1317]WGS71983.1 type II toxin-antitoxin system RelE/ParE family toxin [Pseudanabaena galeata CCNP1313]